MTRFHVDPTSGIISSCEALSNECTQIRESLHADTYIQAALAYARFTIKAPAIHENNQGVFPAEALNEAADASPIENNSEDATIEMERIPSQREVRVSTYTTKPLVKESEIEVVEDLEPDVGYEPVQKLHFEELSPNQERLIKDAISTEEPETPLAPFNPSYTSFNPIFGATVNSDPSITEVPGHDVDDSSEAVGPPPVFNEGDSTIDELQAKLAVLVNMSLKKTPLKKLELQLTVARELGAALQNAAQAYSVKPNASEAIINENSWRIAVHELFIVRQECALEKNKNKNSRKNKTLVFTDLEKKKDVKRAAINAAYDAWQGNK